MSLNLKGKNILIVGGSSGMGLEMTKALLAHEANVVMASFSQTELDNAYALLSKNYKNVHIVQLDVTNEESAKNTAKWYGEHFDSLDLLIEGAGVGDNKIKQGQRFYDIPADAFRMITETNFVGYFIVTKYFVPLMENYGKGKLAYVTTSTNTMTIPGQIPYGPTKAASEAMCHILGDELKDLNITVNVICPGGFTDTPLSTQEMKDFFKEHNLPILKPTIMNKIALFMASDLSDELNQEKLIGKEFDQWLEEHNIKLD